MSNITLYKARGYTGESDLQPICDFLNYCGKAYAAPEDIYNVDALKVEFDQPKFDKFSDIRIWEDTTGRISGYADIYLEDSSGEKQEAYFFIRVHPDFHTSELPDQIMKWGEERLKTVAASKNLPAEFNSFAREEDSFTRGVLERSEFKTVRYFFRMARDLSQPIPELEFPVGYTVRAVSTEEDIEKWVGVFNQSFIDHWNHHPTTVEEHKHYLTEKDYRSDIDLVAVAEDGTFAAFCHCKIDTNANETRGVKEGWIGVLGSRRGYRKFGLGKGMLLMGMRKLKEVGMETAILGVDAENPSGALGLYESVGFYKRSSSVAYRRTL
jgi:mycothiol synthase